MTRSATGYHLVTAGNTNEFDPEVVAGL